MKRFSTILTLIVVRPYSPDSESEKEFKINPSFSTDNYVLMEIYPGSILYVYGYHSFAPYYNENGNLCKYIDGEIVEVTHE